ncbi:MAG: Hsp20/alpha crystallin family protein [Alphaproteobacteria bacterium]
MKKEMEKKEAGAVANLFGHTDSFNALRSDMNRLFDRFTGGSFPSLPHLFGSATQSAILPDVDVRESGGEIVIEAELPGVEEKDISVSIRNGMLTIKGEKKFEHEEEKDDYQRMERYYGSYHRSMSLPDSIDEEKIEAKLDNGVLTVKLAMRPEAVKQERKIEIKSG